MSRVAAKYQVKTSIAVNSTIPMPPTEIAQARSVRVRGRSSAGMVTSGPFQRGAPYSFDKRDPDQDRVKAMV